MPCIQEDRTTSRAHHVDIDDNFTYYRNKFWVTFKSMFRLSLQKNNTGHIKALARNTLINDSQANEGVSIKQDYSPKLDAINPNIEKMTNSRSLKVLRSPNKLVWILNKCHTWRR